MIYKYTKKIEKPKKIVVKEEVKPVCGDCNGTGLSESKSICPACNGNG